MRVFLLFLFFLFVSALLIISNGNLHLKEKSEAMQFGRLYYSWIIESTSNVFKATAYVIKFEWMPSVQTLQNNSSTSR
jgi:hypothetical protein